MNTAEPACDARPMLRRYVRKMARDVDVVFAKQRQVTPEMFQQVKGLIEVELGKMGCPPGYVDSLRGLKRGTRTLDSLVDELIPCLKASEQFGHLLRVTG